jgi:hypothetical protein
MIYGCECNSNCSVHERENKPAWLAPILFVVNRNGKYMFVLIVI